MNIMIPPEQQLPKERMSYLDALDFVVSYYGSDVSRRSLVPGATKGPNCLYNGPDGRHCAVALMIVPEDRCKLTELEPPCHVFKDARLRPEVAHLNPTGANNDPQGGGFWVSLQDLHDGNLFWCLAGLTEEGKDEVERLKRKYGGL